MLRNFEKKTLGTMCVWGSRQCVHSWAYINKSITLRSRNLASSIDECLYVCVCIYIYVYINMNRERARDRTEIYIVIGSLLTEKYIIYAYIYIYIYIYLLMYTKLIWTTGFVQYVLDNEYAQTLYGMYSMLSMYNYWLVTNMRVQ